MSRYVVLLLVPLVVGSLIAIAVLLINGLRERRNLKIWSCGKPDVLTVETSRHFLRERPQTAKTDASHPSPSCFSSRAWSVPVRENRGQALCRPRPAPIPRHDDGD